VFQAALRALNLCLWLYIHYDQSLLLAHKYCQRNVLRETALAHGKVGSGGTALKGPVKTPKLYFLDVGLLAWLLGIRDAATIETQPMTGSRHARNGRNWRQTGACHQSLVNPEQ
jgi:hypothetical protein